MGDFEKKYYEFMSAAAEMRRLQREYFTCRSSLILRRAKDAEKKVDILIQTEIDKAKQVKNLFN